MANNRRRTKLVNSSVQKRLILSVAVLPAIALGIMSSIVTYYTCKLYDETIAVQGALDSLIPLLLAVTGLSCLTVIVLVASTYKLSHRIAGPMYRICKSLERIRGGDVAFNVKLRDGDHLTDISVELNQLLDQLNENPPEGFLTREAQQAQEQEAEVTSEAEASPSVDDIASLNAVSETEKASS